MASTDVMDDQDFKGLPEDLDNLATEVTEAMAEAVDPLAGTPMEARPLQDGNHRTQVRSRWISTANSLISNSRSKPSINIMESKEAWPGDRRSAIILWVNVQIANSS